MKQQGLTNVCRLLLPTEQVQAGSKLTSDLRSTLSLCPSDIYLLVKQAGINVRDFSSPASAPTLSQYLGRASHSTLRSAVTIPEVSGEVDMRSLEHELNTKCGATTTVVDGSGKDVSLTMLRISLILLQAQHQPRYSTTLLRCLASTSQHQQRLNQSAAKTYSIKVGTSTDIDNLTGNLADDLADRTLSSILDLLRTRNYTVIYTTTPEALVDDLGAPAPQQYEMYDYNQPLHTDLKRDIRPKPLKSTDNQTLVDGPLFERYQFLTPGKGPPPTPHSARLPSHSC
jgi:hypothetical protein